MELFAYIGAALVALLVTVLPALAHKQHWNVIREDWRRPLRLVFGVLTEELGVVTVTYYIRGGNVVINGSTTVPTATQANQVMKQSAIVQFGADADIDASFTHNWGLDISAPGFFEPEVFIAALSQTTAGTWMPCFTFDWTNTNVLAIHKLSFLNTAGKYVVTLRRPHSMGQ